MPLLPLRPHQQVALDGIKQSLSAGKRRPVLLLPTGAGKTVIAAHMIHGALSKRKRVAFALPALSLIDQTFSRFSENGIPVGDMGVMQADHPWRRPNAPVQICSIQTIAKRGFPEVDFCIVDENHLRFEVIDKWMAEHPDKIFVGLSATPWARGMGDYWDDLIIPTSIAELIEQGYLSKFRVFAPSHPDLSGVAIEDGDYHKGQLSGVMSGAKIVADVVTTWLDKGDDQPTLCFAVDRGHAQALHDQFASVGVTSAYVDANTEREERAKIIGRFQAGEVKVVCSIGTMTTGVDVDCRCIIMARPTKSEILFVQCLDEETEVLTSHGWKGREQIRIGDCVATMSDLVTQKGKWSPVISVVDRMMEPSEQWIEYDAPRANFRVTDGHRMIFSDVNNKERVFSISLANDMLSANGGVFVPTAVEMDQTGVPLTDSELYFIGMMMTDGTWGPTAGHISQSERYPEVIDRIEKCLRGCGIAYSKRKMPSPPEDAKIVERHARWQFTISVGKPCAHGNQGRGPIASKWIWEKFDGERGFGHLLPYLDKDISPSVMALSKAQFLTLLTGIFDGDGLKKAQTRGVDWTPRSWEICSARKVFIERLQALASINGCTANVRMDQSPSRKNPFYTITVTPKAWRSCGGYESVGKGRPRITSGPATSERVWCIETAVGTMVTRRRGKVTVMGNCIGRGLRPAPGKEYCKILDHSDNHLRLGMVTDIYHDTLRTSKGDAERKASNADEKRDTPKPFECPKCTRLIPYKALQCECGWVSRRPNKVQVAEGELRELGASGPRMKREPAIERLKREGEQAIYSQLLGMQGTKKDGWVSHKFRAIFNRYPSRHLLRDPHEPSSAMRSWVRSENIKWAKSQPKTSEGFAHAAE